MAIDTESLVTLTADIVSAHVSHNNIAPDLLPKLISSVFDALQTVDAPPVEDAQKPVGAVSVRASIKPGHLVSMIDGKPYKMLKRHLSIHGYTPQSYREAFDLPRDYPMVAADYADKRRNLALKNRLGHKRQEAPKPARKPRARKAAAATAGQT